MAYGAKMSKLMTVKETAERLRVTPQTVFNYLKAGILQAVRIGGAGKTGRTLIAESELERFINADKGGEHGRAA